MGLGSARLGVVTMQRGPLTLSLSKFMGRPVKPNISSIFLRDLRTVGAGPNENDELFTYTSRRFLYNEQRRLEERRVSVNVAALKDTAEKYVGHGKIACLQKLVEGGFNRIFLLTSEDGFQTIAKIPYTITVPKKYTTASEVATTDLLRSKGVSVPRIFGRSADANNPVGVEYIIMEKASGIPLETRWFDLSKHERHYLVTSLVDIEKKLFDIPFGNFGIIYYKSDLPPDLQLDLYMSDTDPVMVSKDERFCIGPTTDYMFWYGQRADLEIYRGPWKTPKDYLISIGKREYEWTKRYGRSRPMKFPHVVHFEAINSPNEHIKHLNQYMEVAPYLLGSDSHTELSCPLLRHPDWQHATLLPLLLATGHPPLFQSPDQPPPRTLEKPSLPDNHESLDPEQKSQADELYRRRTLFYIYMAFNGGLNKKHLSGMKDPRVLLSQHLVERAEKQWSGDVFSLKGALIRIYENWHLFNAHLSEPVPCPISFTQSEVDAYYEQEPTWFEMNGLVEYWKSELGGLGDDGWVRTEAYEDTLKKSMELKQVLLEGSDAPEEERCVQEQWPFQDHEERYML
ncbi:phosphotransferase enzyme family protein [Trichophyton equinum CBS 127.97]|uniref:Phosphotransferase enzyme family protein n=1 Tax=Trichophyton equinum (strain ATCC MYA-4606 / CBS 127.97) TaxID=559882 RepID=F2PJ61_TRIEC|nr:phosphotransferase enzyme family protein [Trichophyton equinum CBS 127.97]